MVVFDDVDIESAVDGIAIAGYFNAGQDCTAATRVVAQAGVYDEFLAALTEAVTKTKTGYDPDDEDILYGPINNPNQLRHISDLVSRAPAHARLLAGGKQQGSVGYFYEPTLIADLRPGRRARAEGGLRSGRHRTAVQRRGRGGQVRQR